MAVKKKTWIATAPRQTKPQVPDSTKNLLQTEADKLIENTLKPTYIQQHPNGNQFNFLIDICSEWHRSYFYFYAKYHSPGPNALSPYFEEKFARMEYVANDKFNLSYMRHTGKWFEIFQRLSMSECLKLISEGAHFMP